MIALRFPFFAAKGIKVCAVPGHRPAVMQRPDGGNVPFLDVAEKQFDIDIISMQIMQMNYIRLVFIDPFQKLLRRLA